MHSNHSHTSVGSRELSAKRQYSLKSIVVPAVSAVIGVVLLSYSFFAEQGNAVFLVAGVYLTIHASVVSVYRWWRNRHNDFKGAR